MQLPPKNYDAMVKRANPPSPVVKDCLWAFFVGGAICLLGEALRQFYLSLMGNLSQVTSAPTTPDQPAGLPFTDVAESRWSYFSLNLQDKLSWTRYTV